MRLCHSEMLIMEEVKDVFLAKVVDVEVVEALAGVISNSQVRLMIVVWVWQVIKNGKFCRKEEEKAVF